MALRRGYTFMELVLVAAIISILAAIAVPNFLQARVRASLARTKADQAVLIMGIESYRIDHRMYPRNAVPGRSHDGDLSVLTSPIAYLPFLPDDVLQRNNRKGSRTRPPSPKKFRYLNLIQINDGKAMALTGAPRPIGGGVVAALVWGDGPQHPARSFPPEGFMDSEERGEVLGASLIQHDPTNGTVSPGIILQRVP